LGENEGIFPEEAKASPSRPGQSLLPVRKEVPPFFSKSYPKERLLSPPSFPQERGI